MAARGVVVRRERLTALSRTLESLDYRNVLARGFALVRSTEGTMLRRASEVKPGLALDIEFADGHVAAHADPRARAAEPEGKPRMRGSDGKQGKLL